MLAIEGVRGGYGAADVLHGVTLRVADGSRIAVLGPNGSGKSTLLRIIMGVLRPSAGTICFRGKSIVGLSTHEIVHLGISHVPEGRHIFPDLSVKENLLLGAINRRSHSGVDSELEHILELFPVLGHHLHDRGGVLSGGEQQMLAIGRAMMARPNLMLLDEPSLGLSPRVSETVFQLLRRLADNGTGMLIVEQNAMLAVDLADEVLVLDGGRTVLQGPSQEIRNNPQVIDAYLGTTW